MDSTEEFNIVDFEQRLTNLKDTQDSIQAMSAWCIKNRSFHKKVVSSWLNVLKQVKVEHRLILFYLANDVIQCSKRKHFEFVDSWGTTLQRATTMVRDEKVKNKIIRIFNIWEQRSIYNEEFLADLHDLLSINPTKKQQPVESDDEHVTVVSNNIRNCVRLEKETDKCFKVLSKIPLCDTENIHSLKDRRHVEDVEHEINNHLTQLENCMKSLNSEIKARTILIAVLEQTDAFYHNQRGEVKVVANAYRNFGNRIKTMKRKLDELSTTLPSPIPSPDINAPSPEPDTDFDLPDIESKGFDQSFLNKTNGFLGSMNTGSGLPFDINDFKSESQKSSSQDAQPIQVIGSGSTSSNNSTLSKDLTDFNIDEFFKSLLPDSTSSLANNSSIPQPVPPVGSGGVSLYQMMNNNQMPSGYLDSELSGGGGSLEDNYSLSQSSDHLYGSLSIGQSQSGYRPQPLQQQPPPPMPIQMPYGNAFNRQQSMHYHRDTGLPPPPQSSTKLPPAGITNLPPPPMPNQNPNNYLNHMAPLLPPPLPPAFDGNLSDEYNPETWDVDLSWNNSQDISGGIDGGPFQSQQSIETPISPPHFEREGICTNTIVDCGGGNGDGGGSGGDIDHRQLRLPPHIQNNLIGSIKESGRAVDVDHRNLISLTGSPGPSKSDTISKQPPPLQPPNMWKGDIDFRQTPLLRTPTGNPNSPIEPYSLSDSDYRIRPSMQQTFQQKINTSPSNLHKINTVGGGSGSSNNSSPLKSDEKSISPQHQQKIPGFNSPINDSLQPPPIKMQKRSGNHHQIQRGSSNRVSLNGRDIVESIDMEMSDDDFEQLPDLEDAFEEDDDFNENSDAINENEMKNVEFSGGDIIESRSQQQQTFNHPQKQQHQQTMFPPRPLMSTLIRPPTASNNSTNIFQTPPPNFGGRGGGGGGGNGGGGGGNAGSGDGRSLLMTPNYPQNRFWSQASNQQKQQWESPLLQQQQQQQQQQRRNNNNNNNNKNITNSDGILSPGIQTTPALKPPPMLKEMQELTKDDEDLNKITATTSDVDDQKSENIDNLNNEKKEKVKSPVPLMTNLLENPFIKDCGSGGGGGSSNFDNAESVTKSETNSQSPAATPPPTQRRRPNPFSQPPRVAITDNLDGTPPTTVTTTPTFINSQWQNQSILNTPDMIGSGSFAGTPIPPRHNTTAVPFQNTPIPNVAVGGNGGGIQQQSPNNFMSPIRGGMMNNNRGGGGGGGRGGRGAGGGNNNSPFFRQRGGGGGNFRNKFRGSNNNNNNNNRGGGNW